MAKITFEALHQYIEQAWMAVGAPQDDAIVMANIFTEITKRGVGHHDIHNFPSRIDRVRSGVINPAPKLSKIASYGGMESWDGDHGTGEVLNHFIMQRAIDLASEHGVGMAVVRNSNHYLCSAPYVEQAAQQGYVGFITAKAGAAMGLPGIPGPIIGQAPLGYAFPTADKFPVMMDICLAYIAGEPLNMRAEAGIPIPAHWGADKDGNFTTNAAEVVNGGVKFPIGEHKGFGLALLFELLTGVFSMGAILDEGEDVPFYAYQGTSHMALAIKTDGLMDKETYLERSQRLVDRLRAKSEKIHIPGDSSWRNTEKFNAAGYIELEENLVEQLNLYSSQLHIGPLRAE